MATFARGKGQQWTREAEHVGSLVKTRERHGDQVSLWGYLPCDSELSARGQLETIAAEWLQKGFVPVDASAITLAKVAFAAAPDPAAPSWPLRKDLAVENETHGLVVTSLSLADQLFEPGSPEWTQAVAEGKLIPLALRRDYDFVIRVLGGHELSDQEAGEWVARVEWPLEISDGKLTVSAGPALTGPDFSADDPFYEDSVRTVSVPPGRYLAALYSYIPGINGASALEHMAEQTAVPPLGAWWRASRGGEAVPTWLRQWCVDDPGIDPGHESEWEGVEFLEAGEVPEMVDFVLHLQADTNAEGFEPPLVEGWFASTHGARVPDICPRGLEAKELGATAPSEIQADWVYIEEIFPVVEPFEPAPIDGGALAIAPQQLAGFYRLARFARHGVVPGFRAAGNLRDNIVFSAQNGCVLVGKHNRASIFFSGDRAPDEHEQTLNELFSWFNALPVGASWELACAPADGADLGKTTPGVQRYRGTVSEIGWMVEESFPATDRDTLEAALSLAREVMAGESLTLLAHDEGPGLVDAARAVYGDRLQNREAVLSAGRLTLDSPDPGTLDLYGRTAFARRFAEVWPIEAPSRRE